VSKGQLATKDRFQAEERTPNLDESIGERLAGVGVEHTDIENKRDT